MIELIQKNIDLKPMTSLKVGGCAEYYCAPKNLEELRSCVQWAQDKNKEITILGEGTNTLISDDGILGLVISSRNLKKIEVLENKNKSEMLCGEAQEEHRKKEFFCVIAQSGVLKSKLMRLFLKRKLSPALFLSGLPGNLGGGIFMNAGVREKRAPREFSEIIDWIEVFDFQEKKLKRYLKKDIQWSYRKSTGYGEGFIYQAQISWPLDEVKELPLELKQANQLRLSKQPLDWPSCGSVFKNPEGFSAGALIEEVGLKGLQLGGAQVSTKHANFIINKGNARAREVYDLICKIKEEVWSKKQVRLTPEVQLLGSWPS